ncbi:MAG: murein transglycosylase A [Hyphomicrobiaceae bacterium]
MSKLVPQDAARVLLAFLVVMVVMPLGAKVSSASGSSPSAAVPGATFKPVPFSDLPGWGADDHAAAFGAFLKSCTRLIAAARVGNKAGKVAIPPELLAICADAARLPGTVDRAAAKTFFESRFQPHAVVHKGSSGLLTGYYEPVLDGSRKQDARFKTPIYKRPPDLVNLVEEAQRGAKGAVLTHARRTDKGNVPYSTRAEIDGGVLAGKGLELLYMIDAVDVFFMQVQGSGRIRLPDGSKIRVHYDGKNGHPYTSIGRYLIDKGLLAADKLSLAALQKWLRADPARATHVMHQNASYVFFRELKGAEAENVLGVLEIPLTPGRSLAVDAGVHALGSPVYVSAPKLTHATQGKPFQRLMIAQDVGSAIKGPERGDLYFGSGDAAGALAGVTKHPGKFHVLLPRTAPADASPATSSRARQAKQQ